MAKRIYWVVPENADGTDGYWVSHTNKADAIRECNQLVKVDGYPVARVWPHDSRRNQPNFGVDYIHVAER